MKTKRQHFILSANTPTQDRWLQSRGWVKHPPWNGNIYFSYGELCPGYSREDAIRLELQAQQIRRDHGQDKRK